MSNPAQDEFDALAASQRHRLSHHPADASDDSDANSEADPSSSYSRAKPSLRSNGHDTIGDEHGPDEDDDDDDWDQRYGGGSGLGRKTAPAYTIPKGDIGRHGNTGPKGVIADARAAEREMLERKRAMIAASRAKRVQNHEPEDTGRKWHEDQIANDEDLAEEDGADEEFMEQWRQKRMGELETAKANGTIGASAYGTRRGHGKVQMVDALGYLDAIEESPRGAVVVVFISDDESPVSKSYQSHLSTLASKYSNVRFVALDFEEAEFEHAGVPALLAYKDGNKFADLVPLRDEVPFTCNVVTNLEEAMKRHNIL